MGHMGHTSATHDVHCLPFGCVPGTVDGTRALMRCAGLLNIQTPTGSNRVQPHSLPLPHIPQPTLLGARESDETTLPLLNKVI